VILVTGPLPHYGLDIETDTAAGGLDPSRAAVVAVALSGPGGERVITGPEGRLLRTVDRAVARLEPGILVTWNGAGFDLPFLADRARRIGVRLGLRLWADPTIVRHRDPLAGHPWSYRASWHAHRHLDAYLAYRSLLAGTELSCSLKATARRAGMRPVEVDVGRLHCLPRGELVRYVASDARTTRLLAEARWAEVAGFVDRVAGRRTGQR